VWIFREHIGNKLGNTWCCLEIVGKHPCGLPPQLDSSSEVLNRTRNEKVDGSIPSGGSLFTDIQPCLPVSGRVLRSVHSNLDSMSAVVIWAEKWDAMKSFYATLVGAVVEENLEGFAYLKDEFNEVLMHLVPAEYLSDSESQDDRTQAAIKPIFLIQDVSSKLSELSVSPLREHTFQHSTYVDVLDPDGNVISLRTTNH